MQRVMLKSKIHRATLTGTELHYEGSISIDQDLLEKADILPGEQVQIVNLNNGERLVTYAIVGERGSGTIELNGPAARLGYVGDMVVIISYGQMDDKDLAEYNPTVVHVDENNKAVEK